MIDHWKRCKIKRRKNSNLLMLNLPYLSRYTYTKPLFFCCIILCDSCLWCESNKTLASQWHGHTLLVGNMHCMLMPPWWLMALYKFWHKDRSDGVYWFIWNLNPRFTDLLVGIWLKARSICTSQLMQVSQSVTLFNKANDPQPITTYNQGTKRWRWLGWTATDQGGEL